MKHLQQLNTSFKTILQEQCNSQEWVNFDLECLRLNYEGYTFMQKDNEFNCSYKLVWFPKKLQLDFIKSEQRKALDLQHYGYLQQLLSYKKNILQKWWKLKKNKIRIYSTDYFKQEGKMIYFQLSGNPLIDLKFSSIINRRCQVISQ